LHECFSAVAQPPLPLQEFMPAHPLSLDLQPPMPLHAFMPLQACFSAIAACMLVSDAEDEWLLQDETAPANRPATANATRAPVGLLTLTFIEGLLEAGLESKRTGPQYEADRRLDAPNGASFRA
jgi:hypothetical protein